MFLSKADLLNWQRIVFWMKRKLEKAKGQNTESSDMHQKRVAALGKKPQDHVEEQATFFNINFLIEKL